MPAVSILQPAVDSKVLRDTEQSLRCRGALPPTAMGKVFNRKHHPAPAPAAAAAAAAAGAGEQTGGTAASAEGREGGVVAQAAAAAMPPAAAGGFANPAELYRPAYGGGGYGVSAISGGFGMPGVGGGLGYGGGSVLAPQGANSFVEQQQAGMAMMGGSHARLRM